MLAALSEKKVLKMTTFLRVWGGNVVAVSLKTSSYVVSEVLFEFFATAKFNVQVSDLPAVVWA